MRLEAPAKINLSLEILRRREDGFHDVSTVLQTIDLADELAFEPASEITLEGENDGIPMEENLIFRAACLLRSHLGVKCGARITLRKRIPMAAGLGGGSSDAAATLVGLCRLWEANVRRDSLAALAAKLGSDVPFFLYGGTALGEGRGERITPISPLRNAALVLVSPDIKMSSKTETLYRSLCSSDFTNGEATEWLVAALRNQLPPTPDGFFNGFTRVALEHFEALDGYWSRFEKAGATNVHLSGTGPTLFSLARSRGEAESLHERCLAGDLPSFVVTAKPNPYNLR